MRSSAALVAPALMIASLADAQSTSVEQSALAAARADAATASARADAFARQAQAARTAAARAAAEHDRVAAELAAQEAEVRAAEARVVLVASARRRQARVLANAQAPAERLAAALEALARRPPALALVQPGSVADLVHVRMLLAATLPAIHERSAGLRAELARSSALHVQAVAAAAALAQRQAMLDRQRLALARLEHGKRADARRFTDLGLAEQERAAALGEHARDLVDLMEEQGREAEVGGRLADLAGPLPRPEVPGLSPLAPSPIDAGLGYHLPVAGALVAGLGEVFESGVRSKGLTLAPRAGSAVHAPAPARVAFAGPFRHYGEIAILDHGHGWATLLLGLSRADVRAGDTVDRGQAIGTAAAADPKVTIELRDRDQPVDITRLLPE